MSTRKILIAAAVATCALGVGNTASASGWLRDLQILKDTQMGLKSVKDRARDKQSTGNPTKDKILRDQEADERRNSGLDDGAEKAKQTNEAKAKQEAADAEAKKVADRVVADMERQKAEKARRDAAKAKAAGDKIKVGRDGAIEGGRARPDIDSGTMDRARTRDNIG